MQTLQHLLIAFTFFIIGFSKLAYSKVAPCNASNYRKYIHNSKLMSQHIRQYQTGCNLKNVNLRYTNLSETNLRFSNLQGGDLTGANLQKSDLTGSNLRDTNLTDIKYRFLSWSKPTVFTKFKGAIYNSKTKFSKYFPIKHSNLIEGI